MPAGTLCTEPRPLPARRTRSVNDRTGRHVGCPSSTGVSVSGTAPSPGGPMAMALEDREDTPGGGGAGIEYRSYAPFRELEKVMVLPSGDHAGSVSNAVSFVTLRTPDPSACIA